MTRSQHEPSTSRSRLLLATAFALALGFGLVSWGAAGGVAAQETIQETVQEAIQETPGRLGAILQGLNKTTARVSTIEAALDRPVSFGTLEIVARACHKKPPTETPESAVFLEIVDIRPDSPAVPVFTGWMFASSPAVSAMEHPVYDVWVVDCRQIVIPEAPADAEPGPDSGAGETLDLGQPQAE